jgi:HlyD family secretion protein
LIGGGLLTAVLFAAVLLLSGEDEGVEVETARARVRAISETVTASGKVASEVEVPISSDVSGEVVLLAVAEGDRVQQGQLLLRIRPDFYASQQEQAQISVAQAQTNVAQAQRDVEQSRVDAAQATAERERAERALARQQDLFGRDVISAADLEAARGAFEVARAAEQAAQARVQTVQSRVASAVGQVRSAQAQSRQAGQQLAQTAIYAPISGTVSQLNIELGQRVVGTATMSGTELMRIARLDAMTIDVDINENDVVRVVLGDSARVEVDAYPDDPLTGVVSQIANSARLQNAGTPQAVTNFPVQIRLAAAGETPDETAAAAPEEGAPPRNPGLQLRPGMSGTVDIYTRTVQQAVVIPLQAVTARDFNEIKREERQEARSRGEEVPDDDIPEEEDLRRVVFVLVDGKAEMREVETGVSDDTHIEIRRGLTGNETVITGPFRLLRTELRDGDPVRESDGPLSDDEE